MGAQDNIETVVNDGNLKMYSSNLKVSILEFID